MTNQSSTRQRLLLFLSPADHPHRDAACATLLWIAASEGALFECYFEGQASGVHYGGGHPASTAPADLRGGTFTGGRHLEQLYLLLSLFECEVACLGPSIFDQVLTAAGIPFRARSADIASFYDEVFSSGATPWPDTALVLGDGGRPQGVSLSAYAFHEVSQRRLLAVGAGDSEALGRLCAGRSVEHLWDPEPPAGSRIVDAPGEQVVSTQTRWMAERWRAGSSGLILGDPELVARWAPTAARSGWLPLFGVPQSRLIHEMKMELSTQSVVVGRQQDDRDFLELSRAGVAFQLVDPGRPPFPAVQAAAGSRIEVKRDELEPTDAELARWADEGRVLGTILFWTGMIRELESLYALADVLSLTGLHAGLVLTTASFEYMPRPPLTLAYTPRDLGGLSPRVEVVLASAGAGALLESESPVERFALTLRESVDHLSNLLGRENLPRGWWGTMDAKLVPVEKPSRLERHAGAPFVRLRYGRTPDLTAPPAASAAGSTQAVQSRRPRIRTLVRNSPLGTLFEPLHPFDAYRPGAPGKRVLEAVRQAGFEYAFTKSAFGESPAVVAGVGDLTAVNYTVGRWDGWTPFATINSIADLRQAERRLLGSGRPGWLAGTIDTCLWAFSGPIWERASRLRAICEWMARGGSSGRVVNVTPRTIARYARLLDERGLVRRIDAA